MHPLRVWREKRKLTLVQLGERLEMSIHEVHRIETGKCKSLSVNDALRITRITHGQVSISALAEAHPG